MRALLLGLAKSIYYGQTSLTKKNYYRAKHLPCFLYYLQTWHDRNCWSQLYRTRVMYELRGSIFVPGKPSSTSIPTLSTSQVFVRKWGKCIEKINYPILSFFVEAFLLLHSDWFAFTLAIILLPTLRPRPHFAVALKNVIALSQRNKSVVSTHENEWIVLANIIIMITYGKKLNASRSYVKPFSSANSKRSVFKMR